MCTNSLFSYPDMEAKLFNDSMWLLYFVNAMQSSICYNLIPFATSAFESHSLITVINIVANAMTAAIYIPLAKMLDLWGRAEGFLLMVFFSTIGLIMMAACNGIATFCAAQVLSHHAILSTFSKLIPIF